MTVRARRAYRRQVARELTTEMKKRAFGAVAVVVGTALALTLSATASAQEWLRDRRVGEGAGYQAGDFEVHPGIAAEIGYDSNYLGRSDKTGANLANGAPQRPARWTRGCCRSPRRSRISTTPAAQRAAECRRSAAGRRSTAERSWNVPRVLRSALAEPAEHVGATPTLLSESCPVASGADRSTRRVRARDPADSPRRSGPFVQQRHDRRRDGRPRDAAERGTLDWHFGYQFTGIFFEQASGARTTTSSTRSTRAAAGSSARARHSFTTARSPQLLRHRATPRSSSTRRLQCVRVSESRAS